ncbi:MAG: arginine--tRNA ligase [Patescibacteria group bacterium]
MSFQSELEKSLQPVLSEVLEDFVEGVPLEHPEEAEHGDFSCTAALNFFSTADEYTSPLNLAEKLVAVWEKKGLPSFVSRVVVAKPGFINIFIRNEALLRLASSFVAEKESFYGVGDSLEKKKYLLEHTSPNPQTTIMLGHLRNNFLGMSVSHILENLGGTVVKDCVVNDRGGHVCRALWGYLAFGRKKDTGLSVEELKDFPTLSDQALLRISSSVDWSQQLTVWARNPDLWFVPQDLDLKPDHANLIWYVLGSRAYKLSSEVEEEVNALLSAWEEGEKQVRELWKTVLSWSKHGYAETYERIGSVHDWVWFESEYYEQGKKIVKKGLEKGVFRKSEGAIVTDLGTYGLPDTVVEKSDGTALYLTQDLALAQLKVDKFPSDKYIWTVGSEQKLYFQQLFAICDQLGIAPREKLFHLSHGLISFSGGKKMSTREGNVVCADDLLDDLRAQAKKLVASSQKQADFGESGVPIESLSEYLAVCALKYSLLKFSREKDISFQPDQSLSLEGNSGPYLQYTYARCCSLLRKSGINKLGWGDKDAVPSLDNKEEALLHLFYKFPEMVMASAESYSPSIICDYLYDLASQFNALYAQLPVLDADDTHRQLRLFLTTVTAQILRDGLKLLGIRPLEKL